MIDNATPSCSVQTQVGSEASVGEALLKGASSDWKSGEVASRDEGHADLLNQTDVGLVRVLEDLIDALITRGVIQFTDLPQAAQAKLLERRQSRANLANRLLLMPLGDEDGLV